mmetsp:Transcript_4076/g.3404  ORF Transcript_4076/g.3404 Transcript_4076/m.3404 type:complete len:292 (+) Transcript_4076:421-1296(+)
MPSVRKKINIFFPKQENMIESSELLRTIKFPKNLMYLTHQLPKPSYEEESVDEDFRSLKKKSSESLIEKRGISRSKAYTNGKSSDTTERIGTNSSISKPSRKLNRAKKIMKNNLAKAEISLAKYNYRDLIRKQTNSVSKKRRPEEILRKDMSMNINSHKISPINGSSSRTPHSNAINIKKGSINHSIFNNRKSPGIKNIKKVGSYNQNRPPLYDRDFPENGVSSLPVIVNSLNSPKKSNADSRELVKRYELKGKVMKPSQRLAHLRYNKKSPLKSPGGSNTGNKMKYLGHK